MADDDLYRQLLDELPDGVYFVDRHRLITYWNKGAETISGYGPQQVMGALVRRRPAAPRRRQRQGALR